MFSDLVHTPLKPLTLLIGNLPIRVRLALTRLLQVQPSMQLLGVCTEASELATLARRLRPDLVIVAENHLLALEQLARLCSVPVLLYTSTTLLQGVLRETARWGVYDYINPLPTATGPDFYAWQEDVLKKVRLLSPNSLPTGKPVITKLVRIPVLPQGIVVIGASTGGIRAVEHVVSGLKPFLNWSIVIALHLPAHFTSSFVKRLRQATLLPVETAEADPILEAGKITVILGGRNMVVQAGLVGPWPIWKLNVTDEPSPSFDDPSIDLLMRSAAQVAKAQVVGVVLTGLGHDGTLGAQTIREHGGIVVAQDEASSEVFSMPKSVIRAGWANEVIALSDLASYINTSTAQARSGQRLHTSSPVHTALQ